MPCENCSIGDPCSPPQTVMIRNEDLQDLDITFKSVVYNLDGTSTWMYEILGGAFGPSMPQLSNWLLRLCFDNGNPVITCKIDDMNENEDCGGEMVDNFPCENEPALSGIKFETGEIANGQTQIYTFTLDKHYATEITEFRLKGGNEPSVCGEICGPSPTCITVSRRGIII